MSCKKTAAILIRTSLAEQEELEAAKNNFGVYTQRASIVNKNYDFIIPRYSALPYYKELEEDVKLLGSKLINSYREHLYVADIRNWYEDLKDLTPKTWFDLSAIPNDEKGPFIVKGLTNSKKQAFNELMFAENKQRAVEISINLSKYDNLISQQGVCIRKYIPLKTHFKAIGGIPVTNEYRFFVLAGKIVGQGYYWSEHAEVLEECGAIKRDDIEKIPKAFLQKIIDIVSPNITFFVFDVAETETGEYILIELNDGSMSGLSTVDPNILYSNIRGVLDNWP